MHRYFLTNSHLARAIRFHLELKVEGKRIMESSASRIKVLIADDEEIVRYGLKAILQAEPTLLVVGEVSDGKSAIAQAQTLHPDVVLMDINMPVMNGVLATEEICQTLPHTKVVVLTTHAEDQYLFDALYRGATGYLLKNTPPEELVDSVRSIHKGYLQISPRLGQRLCQQLGSFTNHEPEQPSQARSIAAVSDCKDITPREQDVLGLIAEGASNREIAQILHIAEKTVKNHVSNLLRRVGLRDRTQLAIWANGLKKK